MFSKNNLLNYINSKLKVKLFINKSLLVSLSLYPFVDFQKPRSSSYGYKSPSDLLSKPISKPRNSGFELKSDKNPLFFFYDNIQIIHSKISDFYVQNYRARRIMMDGINGSNNSARMQTSTEAQNPSMQMHYDHHQNHQNGIQMMNNANGMIMNSGDNDQDHNGVVNGGGDDDDHGGTMMVAADNHGKENGDQLTLTFQGQVYVFDSVSPGKVSSSICVKFASFSCSEH